MRDLPPFCYVRHPETGQAILIVRGERGYRPVVTDRTPEQLNSVLNPVPTALQAEAMLAGCMFGWHVPAADPDYLREHRRGLS